MVKAKKDKKKLMQRRASEETIVKPLPTTYTSDDVIPRKKDWVNKQRVLVFAARGINHRDRHLMNDLRTLLPHHKAESKMERAKTLSVVNEICSMKHCNKSILFEGRRKQDLYMWCSSVPDGPSVKFLVENISTLGELKLTGNCLRGSRPLLSFDENFDRLPHLALLKELLTQIFGVPKHHPRSQPFFDHVITFTFLDKRIWYRNYQILSEDGGLTEIGPRFVLNPVKLFDGSFGGETLWENPDYVSPSKHRQLLRKATKDKYVNRLEQKVVYEGTRPKTTYKLKDLDDIFMGDPLERAVEYLEGNVENEDDL